jgi:hypothetical protein
MNAYRLTLGLLIAILFALQGTVQSRLTGTPKEISGYVLSIAFILAVAEFATLRLGRWIGRSSVERQPPTVALGPVVSIASGLLFLNLFAKFLSPYFTLQHRPPPLWGTVGATTAWVCVLVLARRSQAPARLCLIGLAGLVGASRLFVVLEVPFERLTGDMLATINRALALLLAGRFPYVSFPPPMPYLPGIFLSYAPMKWFGGDLRLTNVVCETLTVLVAGSMFWRGNAGGRRIEVGRVALPLLMLNPVWTYFGTNSQYAPFLLVTVVFGRAILGAGPWAQAGALGLLLGTNQMLVIAAPIVFAWWLGRFGLRRALAFSAVSAVVFLAIIAPFLAWNPAEFARIAFDRRGALPLSLMAGRFTLYPLIAGYSMVLTGLFLVAGILAARRARRPESVLATIAITLGAAMLVQPVSFTHYFLPVMALAALATGALPVPVPVEPLLRGLKSRLTVPTTAVPESSSR